ncbi:MAG: hypothetical protein HOE58_07830 [Porticoccaceae bacterium]|jgi:hypothetical protein|nr:hypothetical protein [Porticoccaceae bacterium]MBT4592093.1 hypothetical protein [Porticoccaceae bacterium]MBT6026676.1 hypothetical protein [Porticoccaceae bacterium]MBT6422549.1 hypothetical protein [Porticoccaceae bacterium]
MQNYFEWILSTALSSWVLGNEWVWPIAETFHFFGLSLLIGSLLLIDMRMIGWFKQINIRAVHALLPLVFVGFIINMMTGVLFYFGDPERYTVNIAFQMKMLLIILAGLNALLYYWKIDSVMHNCGPHDDTPALTKVVGAASLIFWFGVLMLGRLIPYLGTG